MKKRPQEPEPAGGPPPAKDAAGAAAAPARAPEPTPASRAEAEAIAAEHSRLVAENARLAAELDLAKQRLLESAADLDNQAKRFARERQVVREEAVVRTAREMIEVLDNLDRVVAAVGEAERSSPLVQGVIATQSLFVDKLRGLGVEAVAALGLPFDPFQHEALFEEPRADLPPGTVVGEILRGWRTANQLVRAAKVRVSRAPAPDAALPPSTDGAGTES
jgi:molecular chaperone GrpE